MKEQMKEIENEIDAGESVFDTIVNLGLVLKVPLNRSDEIKKLLVKSGCRIIYQVVSTDNLYVCKDKSKTNNRE